jgi:hypothetical protein
MKLRVSRFVVRSFDLDHLDLFWEIESFDSMTDAIGSYDFYILRSESPEGPFDTLAGPFQDQYSFRDFSPNLLHKWRTVYYRLKIVHRPTSEEYTTPSSALEAEPDIIALEIQRQEDVLHRQFTGRRCWLFPVRTFGQRCTCFDRTLSRQTRSNCVTCFDTGFVGGYLRPIEFFPQFDPDAKSPANTAIVGETQPRNTSARCGAYPLVKPKDLIVEPENKRWKVVTATGTERLRSVVHQELTLHMVPRGDIEFKLPINLSDLASQAWSDERNFTNPQHVDDQPGGDFDLLAIYDNKPRGTTG